MKCIIFVVMLALAATNASVLPLAYLNPYAPGISLTQGIAGLYGHPTVLAHHVAAAPLAYSAHTLVAPAAAHTFVAAAPAPALLAAPSASYVATTRGAQHVAPLPGHVESVASTNIQPAPSTL